MTGEGAIDITGNIIGPCDPSVRGNVRTELTSGVIAGSGTPNVRAVQSTPEKVGTKVGGAVCRQ